MTWRAVTVRRDRSSLLPSRPEPSVSRPWAVIGRLDSSRGLSRQRRLRAARCDQGQTPEVSGTGRQDTAGVRDWPTGHG